MATPAAAASPRSHPADLRRESARPLASRPKERIANGGDTRFTTGILYALVASDCSFAVDVFVTREFAERALRDVLDDEPEFEWLLSVEEIPLADAFADS